MAALQRPALPAPRLWPRLGSSKVLTVAALALVVGIALLQVNQLGKATSTGYEIEALQRERGAKQAENHELEKQVAQNSSLAVIDLRARTELHMEPATRKLYLSVNADVPAQQTLPTRYLPAQQPPEAPAPATSSPWWKRALDKLPF